ncbi:MAG: AzlC family ABC transporter permease [bacterium]
MRQTFFVAIPVALAIAVFGTIYGATVAPLIGSGVAVLASLIIFSGSLQFALASLLATGAPVSAIMMTAVTLNLRHLLLGAALRPRVPGSILRRAALAWFLIDESAGLALATRGDATLTLLVTGVLAYGSWALGTAVGTIGAALTGLRGISEGVFPVLFVGLAAISATRPQLLVRAGAAALIAFAVAVLWPQARGLGPAIAALLVAIPGRGE